MLRDTNEVSLSEFYSHVLSYEALRAQQAQAPDNRAGIITRNSRAK